MSTKNRTDIQENAMLNVVVRSYHGLNVLKPF